MIFWNMYLSVCSVVFVVFLFFSWLTLHPFVVLTYGSMECILMCTVCRNSSRSCVVAFDCAYSEVTKPEVWVRFLWKPIWQTVVKLTTSHRKTLLLRNFRYRRPRTDLGCSASGWKEYGRLFLNYYETFWLHNMDFLICRHALYQM
jgi:hypothetical protein